MTALIETTPDLTVADVARELQIHPDTVRDLLATRALVGYKPGKRSWRVRREDLDTYKQNLVLIHASNTDHTITVNINLLGTHAVRVEGDTDEQGDDLGEPRIFHNGKLVTSRQEFRSIPGIELVDEVIGIKFPASWPA